ncbi:MAG: GNAT family N-acetyltransferase [Chloroflexi bacterium]|nr:GNAT family N-acetyltransferase [Chloroflexota bacterium]
MNQALIETHRLVIRPFVTDDLEIIHRILNESFGDTDLPERRSWLQWSMLSQEWFDKMHQPPYGDRAVMLKSSNQLIGSVGLVPLLSPFGQIPELGIASREHYTPEVGLFWVIDRPYRVQRYATEAAQAMINFAFTQLRIARILATTESSNAASQGVMRKLGMKLLRNPLPEPPWLQVVGVLDNDH